MEKIFNIVGDLNLNLHDHSTNSKVKYYSNIVFQNLLIMVLMINKSTEVSKSNATIIDHILTNLFLNTDCFTSIIKTDIFDHFPIFFDIKGKNLEKCKAYNNTKKDN